MSAKPHPERWSGCRWRSFSTLTRIKLCTEHWWLVLCCCVVCVVRYGSAAGHTGPDPLLLLLLLRWREGKHTHTHTQLWCNLIFKLFVHFLALYVNKHLLYITGTNVHNLLLHKENNYVIYNISPNLQDGPHNEEFLADSSRAHVHVALHNVHFIYDWVPQKRWPWQHQRLSKKFRYFQL